LPNYNKFRIIKKFLKLFLDKKVLFFKFKYVLLLLSDFSRYQNRFSLCLSQPIGEGTVMTILQSVILETQKSDALTPDPVGIKLQSSRKTGNVYLAMWLMGKWR